jgi:hypothetical protein
MCDNPDRNPWDVYVNPALTQSILEGLLDRVLEGGIEQVQHELPTLDRAPREELKRLFRGVERKKATMEAGLDRNLAHIEFDIDRIKRLSEEELKELLAQKLVPRIIEDIKELEVNRPIPDWCYAFF